MRVSERGQITSPKRRRERFGLNHNVEVEITATERGLLIRSGRPRCIPLTGWPASWMASLWTLTNTSRQSAAGDYCR